MPTDDERGRLIGDESGAAAIEYALIGALIILAIAGSPNLVSTDVNDMYNNVVNSVVNNI